MRKIQQEQKIIYAINESDIKKNYKRLNNWIMRKFNASPEVIV